MGLEFFGRPLWLLLLPAAGLVYFISRRSLAGLPPARRYTALALRILVVVLLVLAAAELRLVERNDRLSVIYAVDVSASIPAEHRDAALEFARRSSSRRDSTREDSVGLLVFGKNAGIEVSPRPSPLAFEGLNTLIEKDFTDLQGALRLAAAVFPEGAARRVVLLTDGNENRGNALEEARAIRDQGVQVDVLPISYSFPGEVLVDKVVVDPEVKIGEPFEVRLVVESTRATRVMLRLFENQRAIHSQEVDLKPGKNVFAVPRRLDLADRYIYEGVVEPLAQGDDAILQNNSASAFTFIHGEPRVLLCTRSAAEDDALLKALRDERINAVTVGPDGLPGEIDEYLGYQAVVLSNIPAHALTPDQMKLLESLVKAVGIGLVMIGGEDSFGAGGYQNTPVEELLPVYMEIKQKKILPNGALAIVMHSCEISNGNYWAKQTVQQAIRVLSPRDYVGVLYYDGGTERWLFPMTQVSQKQYMLNLLATFSPGDMPDFQRIVPMAHQSLKATPASIRHIIILSDGDPTMPTSGQVQAIRQDGITISTICMGWHSNPQNMKDLAQAGGGQFYPLTDPNKLPSIFIREASTVRKSLISERDFRPIRKELGSFLRGIDFDQAPPLKGYVLTTQKETADGELVAPPVEGDPSLDPILSTWTYGLGKSAAFTSDAGRRWAVHWTSWEDYRKFWSQLIRWVSREGGDRNLRSSRGVEGDSGVIVVDAVDEKGGFINGIPFQGTVVDPDYKSVPLEVRQVAPGRYRTEFPVGKKGTYLASFLYQREGKTYSYSTGLSVPYSPEYRRLSTNEDLLRRIADAGLGKVLGPEDYAAPFRRDFNLPRTARDLWRSLVIAAAILFFIDVFVRRVALDFRKAAPAVAALAARVFRQKPRAAAPADERLSALLKKKQEVRDQGEGQRRFYLAPEGQPESPLDESFIARVPTPGGDPKKAPPKAPDPAKPPVAKPAAAPVEESSYTSRLLEAKRRAMGKKDKKE